MLFKNTIQYENSENTSNKYVIRCMKIMIFIMIGIWLLNILNVFPINKNVVFFMYDIKFDCLYCRKSLLVLYRFE